MYAAAIWLTGNVATVRPGEVYRSAQLSPEMLSRTMSRYGIKTVLNLRGAHPELDWYRRERAVTLGAGATQIDMAMSSREWMSREQAKALIDVVDRCEKPLLVHCWRGAERTGWVSAMVELLRPGGTIKDAEAQFSFRYLFLPLGDGALMAVHLDRYKRFLADAGLEHSPERFRDWIASGYLPGSPCREEWPYDPYPIVTLTEPTTRR